MNILILAHGRFFNAVSGYAMNMACILRDRGHNVYLSVNDGGFLYLRVKDLPGLTVLKSPFDKGTIRYLRYMFFLRALVKKKGVEKCIIMTSNASVPAYFIHKFTKGVGFVRFRGDMAAPKKNNINRKLYGKPFLERVVYPSLASMRVTHKTLKPAVKEIVIPYSDYPEIDPFRGVDQKLGREKNDLPVSGKVFVYVGRNQPIKGLDQLLQAFLKLDCPDKFLLLLIKDLEEYPEELKKHKHFISENNLEKHVRIMGRVENLKEILVLCDAGLVCSLGSELICRTVAEYYSAALPVLAFPVNALYEAVKHGYNGLLTDRISAEAYCGIMEQFLELDVKTLVMMKKAAMDSYKKHYSPDAFYQSFQQLL